MNSRFYNILQTIYEDKYLYEIVESGGQKGVRCRIYLTKDELFGENLYKYDNTKYGYHFRKFLSKRHPQEIAYKFEAFAWCWPYDKFNFEIGKIKARDKVDFKVKSKKNRINKFIKNLEKHNLPKSVFKMIEDIRNS